MIMAKTTKPQLRKIMTGLTFVAALIFSLLQPVQAGALVDLSTTQVFSSEKTSTTMEGGVVNSYLQVFRPEADIWITVVFPAGVNPKILQGETSELNINGNYVQFSITLAKSLKLNELNKKLITFGDESGNKIFNLIQNPSDLPTTTFEGDSKELSKLNYLLTPAVTNGSYNLAIQGGEIVYFEKFSNFVLGFRKLDESNHYLSSGRASYAYLEKVELNRPNYTPGIWKLLNKNFELIGRIYSLKIMGVDVYPEGHGIAFSPSGQPVVMTYVPRLVDASWVTKIQGSTILDCVFSQIQNGKVVRNFSLWDWADKHREKYNPLISAGDQTVDLTRKDKAVDFCHVNSLIYSKELNSYVASFRSLDLILVIDSRLQNVTAELYAPGARQHFARVRSATEITSLQNYTGQSKSKFASWRKVDGVWKLSETELSVMLPYCGNAQYVSDTKIWVGGGCVNFDNGTTGIEYDVSSAKVNEIGRLKLVGSSGTYRADLFTT
jgi:hypothetical protein